MSSADTIRHKDLKEPDRFQLTATHAAGWLASHRRPVYGALAAVAAIAVAVGIVSAVQARREAHAGAAVAKLLENVAATVSSVPLPGVPGSFFPTEEAKQRAVVASASSSGSSVSCIGSRQSSVASTTRSAQSISFCACHATRSGVLNRRRSVSCASRSCMISIHARP